MQESNTQEIKLEASALVVLKEKAIADIGAVHTEQDLEQLKKTWLSKEGLLKQLFARLREVPAEAKAQVAQELNQIRSLLDDAVLAKQQQAAQGVIKERIKKEFADLSLPSPFPGFGSISAIAAVERKIASVLKPYGFSIEYGPEIEEEYYCFDSLNIPKHHPARDMQDTFFTDTGHVLRTHTTSIQARNLQKGGLPIKIAAFGRSYRNENEDASHQAMFHQFELVWLDKGLTLSHLQALITQILKTLYGKRRKVSFVPKFYPYTEPSIGARIDCSVCNSKGCPSCGGSGWATVAGAGMIHRKVLEEFKYNPEEVSGFAFGLGTSRLAAQWAGFPNMKALYNNELPIMRGKRG